MNEMDLLVRKAVSGDEAAFARLLVLLVPRWRAVAARILDDAAFVDDALQETAWRTYNGLARYSAKAGIATWSHRILVNVCLDMQRRSRRWKFAPLEAATKLEARTRDSLDVMAMRDAVKCLPEELKAVIALRYDADLSFAEMSEALGIPQGTVSTRLRRALALLGDTLRIGKEERHARS